MTLNAEWAARWLVAAGDVCDRDRAYLSELDRLIGDGDHGENLARGFGAVRGQLLSSPGGETPAELFRTAAHTLISTVGGASGPLYGTALMRAADALHGRSELDAQGVVDLLGAAVDGISSRGGAEAGDKTMLDAWLAAQAEARVVQAAGGSVEEVIEAAARGAAAGAEATEPMIAKRGRASYLGERSRGHRDPGAASSALLLEAAAAAVRS